MKSYLISSFALLACVAMTHAQAMPMADRADGGPSALIQLVGNTSSNSSSNTSSDSGARGSSYVHRHNWSIDSDDGYRRRVTRGSTRIERYTPGKESRRRARRHQFDD
jgi:hypothetical protein